MQHQRLRPMRNGYYFRQIAEVPALTPLAPPARRRRLELDRSRAAGLRATLALQRPHVPARREQAAVRAHHGDAQLQVLR
jgi:hypothetical protein